MRRPVVQLKDLAISPIYSPKLTLPARQGRRVVLWAGSRGWTGFSDAVPTRLSKCGGLHSNWHWNPC